MPTNFPPVLTITGSDSTGEAGIGADIRTISALGGRALMAITSVMVSTGKNVISAHDLPPQLVSEQIKTAMKDSIPRAVKVGMVRDEHTISLLPEQLLAIPKRVMIPSVIDSQGRRILSSQALDAWLKYLLPLSTLLILSCFSILTSSCEISLFMLIKSLFSFSFLANCVLIIAYL